MTATLGDLIDGSWTHLEMAGRHAHPEADGNVSAAVVNAAGRLTAKLARCAADFSGQVQLAGPLRQASDLLARWEPSRDTGSHPVPLHLSAAAVAWGAAGDALATHLTTYETGKRSDWSTVIIDQQSRDRIASEISGHALALSAILDRTALAHALDVQTASQLLRSPAIASAAQPAGPSALRAVPLKRSAAPEPIPQQPQTPQQLCHGIITSTDALRTLHLQDNDTDPREWQRTALAASIITHLATRILTQLTLRAYELNPDRRHELESRSCSGQAVRR
jgi:hypothetical protein